MADEPTPLANMYRTLLESREALGEAAKVIRQQEDEINDYQSTEKALRAAIDLYKQGLDPIDIARENKRLREQVTSLQRANTEEVERKRKVADKLRELREADEKLVHFVNTAIIDLIQGSKSPLRIAEDLRLGLEYPEKVDK